MNVPFDSLWLEVPESPEVARFLEGPQPRSFELMRALRIFSEFTITDSPAEAVDEITDVVTRRFKLTYGAVARPRWYLGEWPGR